MSSDSPIRSAPVRPWPVLLAVGPGIVLAAGVIGSGELINTPLQAARFGFVLLWAVLLSCVIKYFLQVEVGRYCLVHNQTVFEALSPFPGPRLRKTSWLVWAFMGGWLLAQVGSSGLVGAMAGLLHGIQPLSSDAIGSVQIWGVAVAVAVQLLLWRGLYGRLEKIMIGLALLLSLSAVVGLVMLQGTPFRVSGADFRSGLGFSLGETDVRLAAFAVISLIGALGVSGSELVVYPYWVLEKGYGKRLGPRDSEGWLERARGWIGILKLDAGVATLLATVVTAGYFILGGGHSLSPGQDAGGHRSRRPDLLHLHRELRPLVQEHLPGQRNGHSAFHPAGGHGRQRADHYRFPVQPGFGRPKPPPSRAEFAAGGSNRLSVVGSHPLSAGPHTGPP